MDDKFYQHLDPTIGINEPILKSFGDKDDFIKEFGTKFEGDIKKTLKEKLKPGEGFLFGKEGQPGYLKTFGEEMKDVLFEGPEARTKRAVYDYSKGIGLGGDIEFGNIFQSIFGGSMFDWMKPKDDE